MQFFGNIVGDAAPKVAASSGRPYKEFSVAEDNGRDGGPTYYRVRYFGKVPVDELRKGVRVEVKGTLKVDSYMSDGKPKAAATVMSNFVEVQAGRGQHAPAARQQPRSQQQPARQAPQREVAWAPGDDGIPF